MERIQSLITTGEYARAKKFFRAIDHPLRLKVLLYLQEHPDSSVTDLFMTFRIEQSVMSQHLAILRSSRLVKSQRRKREILYSPDPDAIELANLTTNQILAHIKKPAKADIN